jgi:glycosyltransferase involved in cell wall biosynthesis
MIRLAFIVSHPIQYYAPLYRRLARRDDVQIKVFFTWHGGGTQMDHGFKKAFAWDLPLTEGYEYEVVPNVALHPGVRHFFGLRNPSLIARVLDWRPDAVHLTGYSYASHLAAMRTLARRGIPLFFRGDSHLLDGRQKGWRWQLKRAVLSQIYAWPAAFLYVGEANKEYYRRWGVPEDRLLYCPHSIDVQRFAEPDAEWERQAHAWKADLEIEPDQFVILFAGKFQEKKRPLPLMQAFLDYSDPRHVLILVGDGEFGPQVRSLAQQHPRKFRVLPFQNQSLMPVVYRLADLIVLPSAREETWGLAVNEAMACGRPALVSSRVGCGPDLIRTGFNGDIFRADDWADFGKKLASFSFTRDSVRRNQVKKWAFHWSVEKTEETLIKAIRRFAPEANTYSGR